MNNQKIIFVCDFFVEQYSGGAELSIEALLEKCKIPYEKILCHELTNQYILKNRKYFWIFGNTINLDFSLRLSIIKNLKYGVIEFDYKICKFRLPQMHEKGICNCLKNGDMDIIVLWYAKSTINFFMSKKQLEYYIEVFPSFLNFNNFILNSVFSDSDINLLEKIELKKKNDIWLIQDSNSWVKGTEKAKTFAKQENLSYKLFSDLKREQMLNLFAECKGFIFLPNGFDTCPRTTIEAKILGCILITNEYVQHEKEEWFETRTSILERIKNNKLEFWNKIDDIYINTSL